MVGQKKERVVYLDYLRFLAVIAVITTHAVGQHWREVPIYSYEWNVLSVYNAVGKWAVPVVCNDKWSIIFGQRYSMEKTLFKVYITHFSCISFLVSYIRMHLPTRWVQKGDCCRNINGTWSYVVYVYDHWTLHVCAYYEENCRNRMADEVLFSRVVYMGICLSSCGMVIMGTSKQYIKSYWRCNKW